MNVLGKGAEATVYKVTHNDTVLAKKTTSQKEVDIIKLLGYHPNIIQPKCILGRTLFMPVADKDLFDFRAENHPIEEIMDVFTQVVKAIEWCHTHDVIHHDIKLENVLLFGSTAVLIDFGLSVITSEPIQRSKALGTRDYLAPEILDHQPYDHSSDIHALGILLFILVTEKQPWESAEKTDWAYVTFLKNRTKFWDWFDTYYKTEQWFKDLFQDLIIDRIPPIEIIKRIKTLKYQKND